MVNQTANYYGALLLVLMFITWIGIFAEKPSTTGLAVKEDKYLPFGVEVEESNEKCADGSLYGECSSLIKPKFCLNGQLVDYCELCGCDKGELCSNNRCIKEK